METLTFFSAVAVLIACPLGGLIRYIVSLLFERQRLGREQRVDLERLRDHALLDGEAHHRLERASVGAHAERERVAADDAREIERVLVGGREVAALAQAREVGGLGRLEGVEQLARGARLLL